MCLEIEIFFIAKGVQKGIVQMQIAADVNKIVIGHAGNKVCYDIVCGAGDFLPVFWVSITTALNRVIKVVAEYRRIRASIQNIVNKTVVKGAQQGLNDFIIGTVQFRMAVNDIGIFVDQIPQITEYGFIHVQRRGVDAVFNQIGRNIGDDLAVGGSDEPLFAVDGSVRAGEESFVHALPQAVALTDGNGAVRYARDDIEPYGFVVSGRVRDDEILDMLTQVEHDGVTREREIRIAAARDAEGLHSGRGVRAGKISNANTKSLLRK